MLPPTVPRWRGRRGWSRTPHLSATIQSPAEYKPSRFGCLSWSACVQYTIREGEDWPFHYICFPVTKSVQTSAASRCGYRCRFLVSCWVCPIQCRCAEHLYSHTSTSVMLTMSPSTDMFSSELLHTLPMSIYKLLKPLIPVPELSVTSRS